MRWQFHSLIIEGLTNDASLRAAWARSFASLPAATAVSDLQIQLNIVGSVPEPPDGEPQFRQGDLLHYYVEETQAIAHFPRFGQLQLDLAAGTTTGQVVTAVLNTYGVLEDVIAISLSPHLRRRDLFLIHAFAAAFAGQAVLLVGGIGAGKTTTGMALLDAGWQLISNDSPIVTAEATVLQYPGVLAAYPETFARFAATEKLAGGTLPENGRAKISVPAEQIWPDVWCAQAPLRAIFFPQIEKRPEHVIEPLPGPVALMRLLPHAMEQWDRAMMPRHLTVLRQLVEAAPGYTLHLGPDVLAIPALIQQTLTERR